VAKKRVLYPDHAFPSPHAFRAEKRRHLRAVRKALEALRMGCAYMPDGGEMVGLMIDRADLLAQRLSVKEWGR
jgi:hypothetical protein